MKAFLSITLCLVTFSTILADENPVIMSVRKKLSTINEHGPDTLAVGDTFHIKVEGFQQFKQAQLNFFIDEKPFERIRPVYPPVFNKIDDSGLVDSSIAVITFKLTDKIKSDNHWKEMNPFPRALSKKVRFSIGYTEDNKRVYAQNSQKFSNLVFVNEDLLTGFVVFLSILLASFIFLARTTDIIKDDSSLPLKDQPYSLAKTQLAWWTIIIVLSYIYIYLFRGEEAPLIGSTLILLGISAGTTAAAKMIDFSQSGSFRHQDQKSEGWLRDILSDEQGVSIHRFQMVVWTLVLSLIFIKTAFINFQIYQFDTTMLALMGISNGTYVGLKIQENAKDQDVLG